MKFIVIILIFLGHIVIQAQEKVELVIASGNSYSVSSSFSMNNQLIATAVMNTVTIWDVKTGRQIRRVTYSEKLTDYVDSLWFSKNDSIIFVKVINSNDSFEIDVKSGIPYYIKGPPIDYSKYKYNPSNSTKLSSHLYSASKKDILFNSPDNKKSLVFKKVINRLNFGGITQNTYEIRLKINGKTGPPLDSTLMPSFAFSNDSKYVTVNHSVYDLHSGKRFCKFKIVKDIGLGVAFIPGTHTPVTCGVNNLVIWDFPKIKTIPVKNIIDFKTSPDGRYFVCEQFDMVKKAKSYKTIDILNETELPSGKFTSTSGRVSDVSKNADKYIVQEFVKNPKDPLKMIYTCKVIDRKTGKVLHEIPKATKAFFSDNENEILRDTVGSGMYKLNLKNKNEVIFPTDGVNPYTYFTTTSKDNNFITGCENKVNPDDMIFYQIVQVWNTGDGKSIFKEKVRGTSVLGFEVSNDHNLVAFASSFGYKIFIYDLSSGKKIHELKGHSGYIFYNYFSDDGKRLISASMDGTRKVWNLETGKEMVSLITTDPNEYAIVTPDQYYYSTKNAQKYIHFVKGADIYPFAQFDLKYNRPDIIIERMLSANTDMIRPYNLAYQKRLKRLGFTEEMLGGEFHLPKIKITNNHEIPISTNNSNISVDITSVDQKYLLNRLLIRVNGVPIHGKKGIDLKGKNKKTNNEKINIPLSTGENQIAISVMNEKGVESIPANISIQKQSSSNTLPVLHLITIGVSKHEDSQFDLKYAAKDATDLALLFEKNKSAFSKIINHTLTDEEVNLEKIKEIKNLVANSNVDDVVCIFFAGHGLLDVNLNYFLASHQVVFENPENKGIPYEVLEDVLDGIPARKKLILLDACHSGEIDKDEVAMVENTETAHDNITFRAVNSTGLKQVGLYNSFELMKELFSDIKKSSGTMIISSAGGTEYAIEGDHWNNGVFTYCLINGLKTGEADMNKDGQVTVSEMSRYIRAKVFVLTDGKQQPTNRAEVLDLDWRIW